MPLDKLGNYTSKKRNMRRQLAAQYEATYGKRMSSRQWRRYRKLIAKLVRQQTGTSE